MEWHYILFIFAAIAFNQSLFKVLDSINTKLSLIYKKLDEQ